MTVPIGAYFREMQRLAAATEATDGRGGSLDIEEAIAWAVDTARTTHARGNKLMVIGNGGSAAIASHLATDYTKNGGLRTQAFNDGSMLTCLGNDLGYEHVFAKQIAMFAQKQDLLIAISSSGKSPNILAGVAAARAAGCAVATLSGFQPQNPLRGLGDVNFYVASEQYGFVEILHLTLCHAILDLLMGWKPSEEPARRATAAARA
jgi:D-sedoheptulose 7-phosphate isomerase